MKKELFSALLCLSLNSLSCTHYVSDPENRKAPNGCGPENSRWELLQKRGMEWYALGDRPRFNARWREWVEGFGFEGDTIKVRYDNIRRQIILSLNESEQPLNELDLCSYTDADLRTLIVENEFPNGSVIFRNTFRR